MSSLCLFVSMLGLIGSIQPLLQLLLMLALLFVFPLSFTPVHFFDLAEVFGLLSRHFCFVLSHTAFNLFLRCVIKEHWWRKEFHAFFGSPDAEGVHAREWWHFRISEPRIHDRETVWAKVCVAQWTTILCQQLPHFLD